MWGVDMILRETHGNRLSIIALDHLDPGKVSFTIIPQAGGNLSIYGASFDLDINQQVAVIRALLANLNAYAPGTTEELIESLTLPAPR